MKKIDVTTANVRAGSSYPAPFHAPCMERTRVQLGDAAGLTQFGVNRLTLPPGGWSAQRHWHSAEDEFVLVLDGEVVLVTDAGEETLRAGDSAGFKAGVADGHHLINRSTRPAVVLEVGTRTETDTCDYPDIDMRWADEAFRHRDGTAYPPRT